MATLKWPNEKTRLIDQVVSTALKGQSGRFLSNSEIRELVVPLWKKEPLLARFNPSAPSIGMGVKRLGHKRARVGGPGNPVMWRIR